MATNMFLLNINLGWIMGGLLLHRTMKVSKCLFVINFLFAVGYAMLIKVNLCYVSGESGGCLMWA